VPRHSRASSLEHALTISTVSSKVMSIVVDLTNDDLVSAGGFLKEALAGYDSTDDEVVVVADNAIENIDDNVNLPSVGNSVFAALDTFIGPVLSSIVINSNNQPHGKLASRIMHRRPDNWRMTADYYKVYRNIAATIKHFCLRTAYLKKPKMYWIIIWMTRNMNGIIVVNQCMVFRLIIN
jgi:hypothetical protein